MYSYWVAALPFTNTVLLSLYSQITMESLHTQNNGVLGIIMQNNSILKTSSLFCTYLLKKVY